MLSVIFEVSVLLMPPSVCRISFLFINFWMLTKLVSQCQMLLWFHVYLHSYNININSNRHALQDRKTDFGSFMEFVETPYLTFGAMQKRSCNQMAVLGPWGPVYDCSFPVCRGASPSPVHGSGPSSAQPRAMWHSRFVLFSIKKNFDLEFHENECQCSTEAKKSKQTLGITIENRK